MRRSLHTCRTAGRYWTPSPRSRPSHSRRACTRWRRRALNELNGLNPSAFDILSAVGQQLATTGEHVIADVHMDKIRLMLARLRDIEALQAAVQSAYGNCNLHELHHLRVPHAVDIAGCAISWSEAFIDDGVPVAHGDAVATTTRAAAPSAFDILSAVGQQLATTGEHVIADVHMDKIRLMLARMRDIEALQAAVQSAYGNCNLHELHHLRVPHAVDIAGSAISWSEAFIADRADAEDYLPQPADAEALPLDDLLDVILDDEDCVP